MNHWQGGGWEKKGKKKKMELKLFCSSAGVSEDGEGAAWPGGTKGYLFNLASIEPENSDHGDHARSLAFLGNQWIQNNFLSCAPSHPPPLNYCVVNAKEEHCLAGIKPMFHHSLFPGGNKEA